MKMKMKKSLPYVTFTSDRASQRRIPRARSAITTPTRKDGAMCSRERFKTGQSDKREDMRERS